MEKKKKRGKKKASESEEVSRMTEENFFIQEKRREKREWRKGRGEDMEEPPLTTEIISVVIEVEKERRAVEKESKRGSTPLLAEETFQRERERENVTFSSLLSFFSLFIL